MSVNPILVAVVRGHEVESIYRGAACIIDADAGAGGVTGSVQAARDWLT